MHRIIPLALALVLASCAGTPNAESEENAVVHQATEADRAATKDTAPITADTAVLYVNGLGCPLCASNVDKQLLRLRGVRSATVDLSTGTVTIGLAGERRPSPARLAGAVADAGFTLVKIEVR